MILSIISFHLWTIHMMSTLILCSITWWQVQDAQPEAPLTLSGLEHVPVQSPSILYRNSRGLSNRYCFNARAHAHVGRSGKATSIECTPTLSVCTESLHTEGARDRPHPRRSNNKIIITKKADRMTGWFPFFPPFLKSFHLEETGGQYRGEM